VLEPEKEEHPTIPDRPSAPTPVETVRANLGMSMHQHMLGHSTSFKLANDGQDTCAIQHYLGHRNIQHTVL
jgi:site-specific recombinase XerD